MNQKLFLDANFFCAFYNQDDSLTKRASEFAQDELQKFDSYTTNLVLYESFTIISMRSSRQVAIEAIDMIKASNTLNIIWHTQEIEETALSIFKDTHKDFSFIDSSIIATIKAYDIKILLTFDKSFLKLQKKYRFKVIS